MTLEVLMSCMHQTDDTLVHRSLLTGNVVMVNQCDREAYNEYVSLRGKVKMISTTDRGLTKSRNMAIANAEADICLICDDDEIFVPDYEEIILHAYAQNQQADVIIFKMVDRPSGYVARTFRLRFPQTMKVSSWQISFRRERLLSTGVRFDELLGAGTGNGAEEELKFLLDCERAGLVIYYVPVEIASVAQSSSTWFKGFDETFFENRGATTRYIMGFGLATLYAVYYVIQKKRMYSQDITPTNALRSTLRGILEDKITKQAKRQKELEHTR